MITNLNQENLLAAVREDIKQQIISACEPVVEAALKEAEAKVREKIANMAQLSVDRFVEVRRNLGYIQINITL